MVELHTNHGVITLELDEDKAPEDGRELPALREERPLRQHHLPPRDRRLHDPGRRLRARHEAEADRRADQERGRQRPEERQLHGRDGAHQRPALGHRAVLHQRRRQRLPRTTRAPTPQGWGYCVFGKVVEGTDVVDKIKGVKTGNKGLPPGRAGRRRDHRESGSRLTAG